MTAGTGGGSSLADASLAGGSGGASAGAGGLPTGTGGTAAGGTSSAGGATDAGTSFGGTGTGGVPIQTDAALRETHADAGQAGAGPALPEGAWARCQNDSQCTGDRVCTKALQTFTAPGRDGACVQSCALGNTAPCDPPIPGGGQVDCTTFFGPGICTVTCSNTTPCPPGFDCVAGFCYYQ